MAKDRKQINVRVDDELLEAIGEIQRAAVSVLVPGVSEIIREAIIEKRDRIRQSASRRK